MSLMMECIECGKVISYGSSGYGGDLEMADTAHIVGDCVGYTGTISGSDIRCGEKRQIICGECLRTKLPNLHKYFQKYYPEHEDADRS